MTRIAALVLSAALVTLGAMAASAQQMSDAARAQALDAEFLKLLGVDKSLEASRIEGEIWRLWFIGPSEDASQRLADASAKLRYGDFEAAETALDALIADEPGFAEAWNQRAFARFLQLNYDASLEDIAETLAREPRHFGALAGRARIEMRLGLAERAIKTMGEVGQVHPWLARQSPIPADPPPPEPVERRDL